MMSSSFFQKIEVAHQVPVILPSEREIQTFLNDLLYFMFPEFGENRLRSDLSITVSYHQLQLQLFELLKKTKDCPNTECEPLMMAFFQQLETVYDYCVEDAAAINQGDPASNSRSEVIRSYPGFLSIAVYRIAHLLHDLKIPYLPRIMTEFAHSRTGIDIHPAADIGRAFCIDHGTGIVIGATTTIGNRVKMYQGVTLGALSVRKDMARLKRHPTIQDEVVIYAGATILGGDTVIGKGSTIGGNVWITRSVPAGSRVYYQAMDKYQH